MKGTQKWKKLPTGGGNPTYLITHSNLTGSKTDLFVMKKYENRYEKNYACSFCLKKEEYKNDNKT